MKSNFWRKLSKPFFILAPMEEVTDTVFRQIVLKCGRPNVFYTEFTSVEGSQSIGRSKIIHRLKYQNIERPIVAQIWGKTPEDYFKTSQQIVELGFDGLDINMGCPVKKIIKQGACSALINNPNLAKEIVLATKEGLANKIPLSIKTRIGFNQIQTDEWCGFLLKDCKPECLVIHARTVKEQSSRVVHWDEIKKVVQTNSQIKESVMNKILILKQELIKLITSY
jgi:tRNA-dihydrouridine synthase